MDIDFQPKFIDKERMLSQLAFQNRKIVIYDDVDNDSIFRCIYSLMRIKEHDDKVGSKKTIDICINSYGGSVYDGLSLISLIESMKDGGYEINTVNMGYAMSMGFLISLVGTKRKCYRHAYYMNHDISTISMGKLAQIVQDVEHTKELLDECNSIIRKYTKIPEAELIETYKTKTDKYYSANKALELGICDEVI